jgi:transketolase N-terminal domain/subunit
MTTRCSKLYWISKNDAKDLLIFDRGHEDGTIYVYEFKKSILTQDILKTEKNIELWIEKEFGFPKHQWTIQPV